MSRRAVPAIAGLLFAIGLGVSGMTDPTKVLAFLDVGGRWDPSLAFVMVGAIGVHFAFARRAVRRPTTVGGAPIELPTARAVDGRLLVGAGLFGVGWGAAGFCPGPALVSAAGGLDPRALLFVGAMFVGIAITRRALGR